MIDTSNPQVQGEDYLKQQSHNGRKLWGWITDTSYQPSINPFDSKDLYKFYAMNPIGKEVLVGVTVGQAMEVLCKALVEGKNEGSYYHGWQANIATAFKDLIEYDRPRQIVGQPYLSRMYTPEQMHGLANQAAKNFLDLLISQQNIK